MRMKTRLFLRNNESSLFFLKMKQMVQINCMCWEIEEEKDVDMGGGGGI